MVTYGYYLKRRCFHTKKRLKNLTSYEGGKKRKEAFMKATIMGSVLVIALLSLLTIGCDNAVVTRLDDPIIVKQTVPIYSWHIREVANISASLYSDTLQNSSKPMLSNAEIWNKYSNQAMPGSLFNTDGSGTRQAFAEVLTRWYITGGPDSYLGINLKEITFGSGASAVTKYFLVYVTVSENG
jgi:hypothetical protein